MLTPRTATATYRTIQATASPARLLDGLFQRLLSDMNDVAKFIEQRDLIKKSEAVNHGILILSELDAALDRNAAPELCNHLSGLYGFVQHRLLTAALQLDARQISEAKKVIETLRESFATASGVTT